MQNGLLPDVVVIHFCNRRKIKRIFSSVEEGDYSIERGAQKAEMGISEFESAMIKAGYKVPADV